MIRYLSRVPVTVAPGQVVIHNSVRPQPLGHNGFRAWTQDDPRSRLRIELCACGWAPQIVHYRVIKP